jgi:hypothetical protein
MSSDSITHDGASTDVTVRAKDKKVGMTLDEVAVAVQLAMRLNVPGNSRVKVSVGFGGQVQQIVLKAVSTD